MKKKFSIVLSACALLFLFSGCSNHPEPAEKEPVQTQEATEEVKQGEMAADEYAAALKEAGCKVGDIKAWDENTDPNGLLGRPGQYVSKADFTDTTCEQLLPDLMNGGTIETFASKADCDSRYEYLKSLDDPSLGAFGLNQYMYKSDLVILRVSYDVTPTDAEAYKTAFDSIK